MITYIDNKGKQHKHLTYMGGDFIIHRDKDNKPLRCCRQKRIKGISGKIFTACQYSQWLYGLQINNVNNTQI